MLILVSLAYAEPTATFGEAMVFAEDAFECSLKVDGTPFGRLPVHATRFPNGHHEFRVECPDGRVATTSADVAIVSGQVARVELTGLVYSAPTPEVVTGPVPTYVLTTSIRGQKVSIDGGAPLVLPTRVNLGAGAHSFVLIEADGTRRAAVTKDVVPHDGQAVVKLE